MPNRYFSSTTAEKVKSNEADQSDIETSKKQLMNDDIEKLISKDPQTWKDLCLSQNEKTLKALQTILTQEQQNRVNLLCEAILSLNSYETALYWEKLKAKTKELHKQEHNIPAENDQIDEKVQWNQKDSEIAKLFTKLVTLDGKAQMASDRQARLEPGGNKDQSGGKPEVGASVAPAKATEKMVSIELGKVDAANKIKVIKEIRSILNLGLKESKDLVEKAPVLIKEGIKEKEAAEIRQKLQQAGATVEVK